MAMGKTPPGSTTSPQVSRELPKSEQRKLKGVFQSSGGARDVAPHPGETHIPPNSEGFPQERPLDDWDIKVQEVENRYIDSAAHFSGQPFTEEQRPDLKHAIKELHVNIFDMLNRYNQRVAALLVENRIAKKDADAVVRPLVRDLMPLVEELKGLEKSLDANASKSARKDVKTALKAAKKNLDKARPMLVEAKVLLAEATRVAPEPVPGEKPVVKKYPEPVVPPPAKKPEKAQVSPTKKTAPVKKTKKNGQSNISPELRLAEIMKELGRSRKAPRLQETIETTFECLQEILEHKFPGWIRERVEQGADPEELAAYQSAFARSFSQVQAMTSSPVASDNVAIHRENL